MEKRWIRPFTFDHFQIILSILLFLEEAELLLSCHQTRASSVVSFVATIHSPIHPSPWLVCCILWGFILLLLTPGPLVTCLVTQSPHIHTIFPVRPLHSQFPSLHWTSANESCGYKLDLFLIQMHVITISNTPLTDYFPIPSSKFASSFTSIASIFTAPIPQDPANFSISLDSWPPLLTSYLV